MAGAIEPLATARDYAERYGEPRDAGQVETRLLDASAIILSEVPGYTAGADAVFDAVAKQVCCEMVHNAMSAPMGVEGATQFQQSAGSYSASMSFANADGSLRLLPSMRQKLGIDSCAVMSVGMVGR